MGYSVSGSLGTWTLQARDFLYPLQLHCTDKQDNPSYLNSLRNSPKISLST